MKEQLLAALKESDDNSKDTYITQTEVVYDGTAIKLPKGMAISAAIANLERLDAYEKQSVNVSESIDCFPQDGAVALQRVLKRRYGWATAVPSPGFFGPEPPLMMAVEVGPRGQTVSVPWGRFQLPNITGWIATSASKVRGRMVFQLQANVLRRHESEIKAIADEVRHEIQTNSIYRGKAVKLSFTDESSMWSGNTRVAHIEFMDVADVKREDLIYSERVKNAILTNLIAPLENRETLKRFGIPFKRGVLLAGVYGTGKTMATNLAARVAQDNGITFVHIERAADFADGLLFARQYQASVLSCEDIDRVTSGERDASLDAILNVVDGIDSKNTDVMVVVTTNNVHAIHQGMLRPGRLDAIVEVEPPDARAVEALIRLYGRGLVDSDANLTRVGGLLQGQIPAVVREVVERAKLAAIRLGSLNEKGDLLLTEDALVDSAETMRMQIALLNRKPQAEPNDMEKLGKALGASVASGIGMLAESLANPDRMLVSGEPDGDGDLSFRRDGDGGREEGYGYNHRVMTPAPYGALDALSRS